MLCRYEYDGGELVHLVPPTARDVLEWTVFIRLLGGPLQIANALSWAAEWCMSDAETLGAVFDTAEAIVDLCDAIAASACIPDDRLTQMRELLDAQNGIPKGWKPPSPCECVVCKRGAKTPVPGQQCIYETADARTVAMLALTMDVEDDTAPMWLEQIRAERRAAESRRLRYRRQIDEENEKTRAQIAAANAALGLG